MPTILDHKDDYLLVVGGTGFIGQWVVKAAIKRGYKVGVLSSTHLQTLKKFFQDCQSFDLSSLSEYQF